MGMRSIRTPWRVGLLASLLVLACDPPGAGGKGDGARGAAGGDRDPVADAALGKAKVVVLKDGTIQIFDRFGRLRATILDPKARFTETIEITGATEWAKPNAQLTIPLGGLGDLLVRRGDNRKAKAALEAKGLTESQRLMVAIAEAAEMTELSLAGLDGELETLWNDPTKPALERRRLIFARWDECEEGTVAEPLQLDDAKAAADRIRTQAGVRARAAIEAFVRKTIPAGSPDAYPKDELSALNEGRTSRGRFAPYDEPEAPPVPGVEPAPAPEPAPE